MVNFDTHHNSNTKPYPYIITFGTNQFHSIQQVYKYYFKICHKKMNQQDYTGYIHSTSEQVQFGSGQAQSSSGQTQSRSEQINELLPIGQSKCC